MSVDCPFCHPAADRLFHLGRQVLGICGFPVNPGHALYAADEIERLAADGVVALGRPA